MLQQDQQQPHHDRVISYELDITSSVELDYTDDATIIVPSYTHQAQVAPHPCSSSSRCLCLCLFTTCSRTPRCQEGAVQVSHLPCLFIIVIIVICQHKSSLFPGFSAYCSAQLSSAQVQAASHHLSMMQSRCALLTLGSVHFFLCCTSRPADQLFKCCYDSINHTLQLHAPVSPPCLFHSPEGVDVALCLLSSVCMAERRVECAAA
jgi:hypothetical protein